MLETFGEIGGCLSLDTLPSCPHPVGAPSPAMIASSTGPIPPSLQAVWWHTALLCQQPPLIGVSELLGKTNRWSTHWASLSQWVWPWWCCLGMWPANYKMALFRSGYSRRFATGLWLATHYNCMEKKPFYIIEQLAADVVSHGPWSDVPVDLLSIWRNVVKCCIASYSAREQPDICCQQGSWWCQQGVRTLWQHIKRFSLSE